MSNLTPAEIVAEVLAKTPIIDGHNDLPAVLRANAGYSVAGLDREVPGQHTDLVRLRLGGVGAQFWSAWVPATLSEPEAVVATLEQIDAIHRLSAEYPQRLRFARTAADIRAAWEEGKIASLIGVEGGHSIAESLGVLRCLARLGVRYLTLTHGKNTAWADSATDQPGVRGLSADGLAIVAELNRIGVLVDLSHTSADTQRAGIAASKAPVIFSHSSAFAVSAHPRNVPDDVLEVLARNGGVVQATFVADFLSADRGEWFVEALEWAKAQTEGEKPDDSFWKPAPKPAQTAEQAVASNSAATGGPFALFAEYAKTHPAPPVTIATLVAHIEHLRDVAGIAHIGIGSDFDGTPSLPEGLPDVAAYPRLLQALAERGWSRADLRALTGENVLRVVQAAEDAASEPLFKGLP